MSGQWFDETVVETPAEITEIEEQTMPGKVTEAQRRLAAQKAERLAEQASKDLREALASGDERKRDEAAGDVWALLGAGSDAPFWRAR